MWKTSPAASRLQRASRFGGEVTETVAVKGKGARPAAAAADARIKAGGHRWWSGCLLQVLRPFAQRRQAVHAGAVGEGALAGGGRRALAAPGLEGCGLKGAAIGEGEPPGKITHGIEKGEMM